jgi:hypothetical protein
MAKDITIGGRDAGRTSGGGGNSGGCRDLIGKNGTVDRNGNVSWHGREERKDGGGYPSGSNGYGGDHGGGSRVHGSYSGKPLEVGGHIYSPPPTSERVHSCLANTDQFANYNLVALYKTGIQGQNGKGLLPLKVINLSNNNLDDFDAHVMNCLYMNFELNLDVLNLSNNHFGQYDGALCIMNLNMYPYINIKSINLSNNGFTDKAAKQIADNLDKVPALQYLDVSGNKITLAGEGFFVNALQQPIVHDIILVLKRAYDIKTILSGSKEEKQFIIKETLQLAQDNGVDVKNIAVSKGVLGFLDNLGYVISDFGIGFAKCNIVPEDTNTFAVEAITAKVSKKAVAANTAKDAVLCFFESMDEVSISPEGIQLIKDLDLVGANLLIDSLE